MPDVLERDEKLPLLYTWEQKQETLLRGSHSPLRCSHAVHMWAKLHIPAVCLQHGTDTSRACTSIGQFVGVSDVYVCVVHDTLQVPDALKPDEKLPLLHDVGKTPHYCCLQQGTDTSRALDSSLEFPMYAMHGKIMLTAPDLMETAERVRLQLAESTGGELGSNQDLVHGHALSCLIVNGRRERCSFACVSSPQPSTLLQRRY